MGNSSPRMRHYPAPDNPSVIIAEIVGTVDLDGSTRLLDFLLSLIAHGHRKLVIDIDRADFVDRSGLDALTGVFNAANRHGGYVVLSCSQELVLQQCRSAGVIKFFSIWPNSSEAAIFLLSSS